MPSLFTADLAVENHELTLLEVSCFLEFFIRLLSLLAAISTYLKQYLLFIYLLYLVNAHSMAKPKSLSHKFILR